MESGEIDGDGRWLKVVGGVDGELRGLTTYGGESLGREIEESVQGEFRELARESGVDGGVDGGVAGGVAGLGRRERTAGRETCMLRIECQVIEIQRGRNLYLWLHKPNGGVRRGGRPSSSFAVVFATRFGNVAVCVLAVTRQAAWIGDGKWALDACQLLFTGVGPDVCVDVGFLEGLVIAARICACVHTDDGSQQVRNHLV